VPELAGAFVHHHLCTIKSGPPLGLYRYIGPFEPRKPGGSPVIRGAEMGRFWPRSVSGS